MTQFLRYAAKSDVGMVRRDNEDSGYAGRTLLVVADGMGGHAAGELASSTAVATLAELDSEDLPAGDVLTALDDAMVTSAERIAQFIQADPSRAGMGTTLTAVLWRGGRIALIHVGDSRAYLLRAGELSQITHDHTYVQTLIDSGRITADEARTHPKRNLLLRAIDGTGVPEGETSIREAQVGDRYLLCSDGLCGVVTDAAIEAVLAQVPDPTAAVTELVDLALAAGAPDNVTAVIADVIEVDDADHDLESALGGPVVVGAAGDRRNRAALPGLMFPDDVGPGNEATDATGAQGGPAVAGGLAARSQVRARSGSADEPDGQDEDEFADEGQPGGPPDEDQAEGALTAPAPGSIGAAVEAGVLPVASAPATAVGAPPDESPQQPGWLRRHWPGLAAVAAGAGVLLLGALGFLWWLSSQWFVGPNAGYVAIYQGIPQQVAGVPLNRVVTRTALPVTSLPYYDQSQLGATLDAATEAEAQRIVTDLEAKSASCTSGQAPLGCPVVQPGTGSGTTLPGASPSPTASPGIRR
jgi:PPM family protein phosphatase